MTFGSRSFSPEDLSPEHARQRQTFLRGMFSAGEGSALQSDAEDGGLFNASDETSVPRQNMDLAVFKSYLAFRYKAPVQTAFFSKTISKDPIAISRLQAGPCLTRAVAPEPGFAVIVYLSPIAKMEGWIDGRHVNYPEVNAGDVVLLDLEASPIAHLHQSVDFLRLQISRRTLHDLAYDLGERPPVGLRTILGGVNDPILYGLSRALEAKAAHYGSSDQLFIDQVALAFHAHLVRTYAPSHGPAKFVGGLAPWQMQRAREMMLANLSGDIAIVDIAQACGLSVSYFARAFRQTVGVPPYKWLMNERIQKAKTLLRQSRLGISEVALACGFVDQSHLTRVFRSSVGRTPRLWRQGADAVAD
ncbi:helix-turn-helix transcriptional regulator [Mesorhizobium sp. B2-4-15]|uniref:AraC family transcriptional regulator n=1 Tax=Mesorhizobium sp. B2-4-15 TaxID=2589934 RepID=UPI0011523B68|nr:AraC family transcriptional regulator [Mesorhizobium sp. B2-4-15]TPK69729.1 helix-turn-helix transcriptional regulator [Mesorhizobium sp. B2-4-15]